MSAIGSHATAPAPTLASQPLPKRVRALLEGILEYASDEIERTLFDMLNDFEQQLFKFAEQARNPAVQSRWLEAQRLVKRTRADLIPRFLIELEGELASIRSQAPTRGMGASPFHGGYELSLVGELDMDESAALTEISNRAEVHNSLPLYLLGQRFGVLAGKPAYDAETLPVGPQALCRMLRQSAACLELGAEHRILLYRTFERELMPIYTGFVEALNTSLAQHGVLPNLKYVPVRIKSYTGGTGVAPRVAAPRRDEPGRSGTGAADSRSADNASSIGLAGASTSIGAMAGTTEHRVLGADSSTGAAPGEDAFQLMRQLLSGRRQLLGKLGNPRAFAGNQTQLVETQDVLGALGALQRQPLDAASGGGKAGTRSVAQLKQDLLAHLRSQLPDQTAPALAEEDGDAIDLVGMLFDHIMKDVRPQSPASSLLSKLQAPLLRVALQDKSFFTKPQHPARQMLNAIAESGAAWLGEDDPDHAMESKMQSLVDRTVRDFDGDISLFQSLLDDLSAQLQTMARKAEVAEKRQVEAARGKEKLALARQSAGNVIDGMLKKQNLPRFTHTLLSQAWTDVLALTALRHGEESDLWRQQLEVAQRLIQIAKAPAGQPALSADEADQLRGDIQTALAQVGYHEQESLAIAQRLVDPQGTFNEDDGASRTELTMRLKARARLGSEKEDVKTRSHRLSAEALARLEQIKHLPFGTWFEFTTDQQGAKVRRRLSWFSTVTGHALFVNQRGQKVGEHTLEGLARAMAQGQVRIVEEEKGTLIDRAWGAVMGALRSFAGQKSAEANAK